MLKRRLPSSAVRARHRVGDHVLAWRQVDDEMRHQHVAPRRREPVLVHDTAPRHVARVLRRHVRPELGSNGGAHAVGADQEVGLDAGAVLEVREHAFAVRLEAREVGAGNVALVREVAAQQAVEMPPRRLDLRQAIAREDAAVGAEGDALLEPHAIGLVDGEPQALERDVKLRVGRDADAPLGELGADALVHRHVAAGAVQHVAGKQPAHGPADDDHARAPGALSGRTVCHGYVTPFEALPSARS